jgi:hypothetical protein
VLQYLYKNVCVCGCVFVLTHKLRELVGLFASQAAKLDSCCCSSRYVSSSSCDMYPPPPLSQAAKLDGKQPGANKKKASSSSKKNVADETETGVPPRTGKSLNPKP